MEWLNMALLREPKNWIRIGLVTILVIAGSYLLAKIVTPDAVE